MHHSQAIKILGVWIDYQLSFFKLVDATASKLRQPTACLKSIALAKDLSPVAMNHVAVTRAISAMLWGSPTWWTGSRVVLDRLSLAYHSLA